MAEQVVPRVAPATLDPDIFYTAEQICTVRPALTERWFKTKRDDRLLPYTKTGGLTSPCLYRLRDVDALLAGMVVPAERGPLAPPPDNAA